MEPALPVSAPRRSARARARRHLTAFGRDDASGGGDGLLVTFFDVLHHDGVDLIDEPLSARQVHLDALVGPLAVTRCTTGDAEVAAATLTESLATGHEGVVVKALDSAYDAGRRGGSWRKVKPVRTLSLVVLAAEWGHGRRRGGSPTSTSAAAIPTAAS